MQFNNDVQNLITKFEDAIKSSKNDLTLSPMVNNTNNIKYEFRRNVLELETINSQDQKEWKNVTKKTMKILRPQHVWLKKTN